MSDETKIPGLTIGYGSAVDPARAEEIAAKLRGAGVAVTTARLPDVPTFEETEEAQRYIDAHGLKPPVGASITEYTRNARLISAAPTIADQHRRMRELLRRWQDMMDGDGDADVREETRALLAEIDGTPPAQQHMDNSWTCPTCGHAPQVLGCREGECHGRGEP